jgi:hypothetical protein
MPEKRMLIVPAELVRKIDENRGEMTQAEFIEFLIDSQLKEKVKENKQYATKEEMHFFEEDIKKLLKSFLDFFVGYGLELGKGSPKSEFEELSTKLHELESDLGVEGKRGEAKIKWK